MALFSVNHPRSLRRDVTVTIAPPSHRRDRVVGIVRPAFALGFFIFFALAAGSVAVAQSVATSTSPIASEKVSEEGPSVPPATSAAPATSLGALEERLRAQQESLERLERLVERQNELLTKQQAEIDRLQGVAASPVAATDSQASPPATADAVAGADDAGTKAGAAKEDASKDDDAPESYLPRWARIKPSGEVRVRYDNQSNRGFDDIDGETARNRFRLRLRFGLAGRINSYCDWGVRLTSGDVDNQDTQNKTFDHGFSRKSIGIDRAYIHFDSDPGFDDDKRRARFEVTAGKMPIPYEVSEIAFDDVLQPEGFAENVTLKFSDSMLSTVDFTTFQLSYNERDLKQDAYIYGGQVNPTFTWSSNWSTDLWGQFFYFRRFGVGDLRDPNVGPPPPPGTFLDSRLLGMIAEVDYSGWGEKGDDASKWELALRVEWMHNFDGVPTEKNGYTFDVELGRLEKKGDWLFESLYSRARQDVFPPFFVSPDDVGTNSQSAQFAASYLLEKRIKLRARYVGEKKLETTSPVNRWSNRTQFDVTYSF